jgi:disulfide oxidoreductase YuzD
MDPITSAFVTALAIPVAKDVIKDGYEALKAALKKKFGDESDVVNAVEQLEKKPDSEGRKSMLQEEVENAKIYNDPQMVKLAEELLSKLKEQPGGQEIITQTQTNTVSGVNVGGNFEFKPVQEGKKS